MTQNSTISLNGNSKLRAEFHDPVREFADQLKGKEQIQFHGRVLQALDQAREFDDIAVRSRAPQVMGEELRLHRLHNENVQRATERNEPVPPAMMNKEISEIANTAVEDRIDARRQQMDADIRRNLNSHCLSLGHTQEVFTSDWDASEHAQRLAEYLDAMTQSVLGNQQEIEQDNDFDMEAE